MDRKRITDNELHAEFQRVSTLLGRTPSSGDIQKLRATDGTCFSHATYLKRHGTWSAVLDWAGLQCKQKLSREQLIEVLQRRSAELGRAPTARDLTEPRYKVFQAEFGSLQAALRAAKIVSQYKRGHRGGHRRWTREAIIIALKKSAKRYRRTPRASDFLKARANTPTYWTIQNAFQSFRDALLAAELVDTPAPKRSYARGTNEELAAELQRIASELGKTPSHRDVIRLRKTRSTRFVHTVYYRRFGSWPEALEAAGLKAPLPRRYTDKALIQYLHDRARELGRSPKFRELVRPSGAVMCARFGSHIAALQAANLPPPAPTTRKDTKWSQERLVSVIREFKRRHGRNPKVSDFSNATAEHPNIRTFYFKFRSFRAAIQAADS